MLFTLDENFTKLEPVGFEDFGASSQLEKQLEDLLADSLCEKLFWDAPLLPFFQ
ncbi:hypothetical protein [Bremerella alba]|uniref:Uncharacterized protein n=1 Tax=Bremerella alba TaxID=980252 RepID=A0A7V8V8M6_9BACT|nr:hypothetical protein [Bremerella alba]MBA2116681.1 hypothetical protein [Bremerella alba]